MRLVKTIAALALVAACGSDTNPAKKDAAIDSKPIDSKPIDAPAPMLTVKDAPVGTPWCSVTVGSMAPSLAGTITQPITASGKVTLVVTPNTGFKLDTGMWHHTDGDTGSGDSGTVSGNMSTTTVTVTAGQSKCVWVCCPGTNGVPACPTTDQCP